MIKEFGKLFIDDHAELTNLPWSVAGHTIDIDVDFGGFDILNVENIGVGTVNPFVDFASTSGDFTGGEQGIHINASANPGALLIEGDGASLYLGDRNGGANDKIFQWEVNSGTLTGRSLNDDLTTLKDVVSIDLGVGSFTVGNNVVLMEATDIGNANRNVDFGDLDPHLRLYSSDATEANDYIEFFHDQGNGRMKVASGSLVFDVHTGKVVFQHSGTSVFNILGNTTFNQVTLSPEDIGGNQVIITNDSNSGTDHGHAIQIDPTLYGQSDTSPTVESDEWWSITHNKTNVVYGLGSGAYTFPDGNMGINESNPLARLQITESGIGSLETLRLNNPTDDDDVGNQITWFAAGQAFKSGILEVKRNGSGVDFEMLFSTTENIVTTDASVRMSIDGAGQVHTHNGRIVKTIRVEGTYTILATDDQIFANTDGGAYPVTLPAGIEGTRYRIINTGSSINNLTVTPDGSEHLLGANSNFILTDGEALELVYNSTDGWY